MPAALALVFHAHQPVGNFDSVIEEAFQTAYEPMIAALERHPRVRAGLHFSGFLLDWIAARHGEYIERLQRLWAAGQIEIMGGGYYEPILAMLREPERQAQMARQNRRIEDWFGATPRGFWLAERVWEPDLAASLARAGLQYVIVDDTHLQLAGQPDEAVWAAHWTEHQGQRLRVVASDHFLRRAIPFLPEAQSLEYLAQAARKQSQPLLVMGDDLEKFGAWPHTWEHVHQNGWLERFFHRLEGAASEVECVRLGDWLEQHPPQRRVYLPAASYQEMMRWALPPELAQQLEAATAEPGLEKSRRFLAGAPWRNFLVRYPEANLNHQLGVDLSLRLERMREGKPRKLKPKDKATWETAHAHLLAAQCNDAYWHGLFGGLYAPHLRNTTCTHLAAADRIVADLELAPATRRWDLDLDGAEEVELRGQGLRALVAPADGGTLKLLESAAVPVNLTHSLRRRPERYHEQIRQKLAGQGIALLAQAQAGSAADAGRLAETLIYDRYERAGGRLFFMPEGVEYTDYLQLDLREIPDWADAAYAIASLGEEGSWRALELRRDGKIQGQAAKAHKYYRLHAVEPELETGWEIEAPGLDGYRAGLEFTVNLLAPAAADRRLEFNGQSLPIEWAGVAATPRLCWRDGWRGFQLTLEAAGAVWWIQPLYTVSQSEAGFERVYQGSACMAVFPHARQGRVRLRWSQSGGATFRASPFQCPAETAKT